jgi:hypothetical protein
MSLTFPGNKIRFAENYGPLTRESASELKITGAETTAGPSNVDLNQKEQFSFISEISVKKAFRCTSLIDTFFFTNSLCYEW